MSIFLFNLIFQTEWSGLTVEGLLSKGPTPSCLLTCVLSHELHVTFYNVTFSFHMIFDGHTTYLDIFTTAFKNRLKKVWLGKSDNTEWILTSGDVLRGSFSSAQLSKYKSWCQT